MGMGGSPVLSPQVGDLPCNALRRLTFATAAPIAAAAALAPKTAAGATPTSLTAAPARTPSAAPSLTACVALAAPGAPASAQSAATAAALAGAIESSRHPLPGCSPRRHRR